MSDQPGPIARLMEIDARETALLRRRGEVRSLAETVIAALPDALVVIDREGAVLVFNAAAELMFGYAEAEMIGQPIEQLMPAGFRAAHVRDRAAYESSGRTERVLTMGVGLGLTALRRDGVDFPVEITLSRFVAPAGPCFLALVRHAARRTPQTPEETDGPRLGIR
jgi:protein-histidine pros-kinase